MGEVELNREVLIMKMMLKFVRPSAYATSGQHNFYLWPAVDVIYKRIVLFNSSDNAEHTPNS